MKRWLWIPVIALVLLVSGWLYLRHETVNEIYPALDALASIPLSQRWSHPEMIKIRQLGPAVIPQLRRVLREKDKPTIRGLLWLKAKWPWVTRYYRNFPDSQKLSERRWTACQVIQTLGPAGKAAVPELIQVIESKDGFDVNGGTMALWAVGIDAVVCERLDESLEEGKAGFGRVQIVSVLGNVRPPSTRTLKALTKSLTDTSPGVQERAAETLGNLGIATPEVVSGLKKLQAGTGDDLIAINCSVALWQLDKHGHTAATSVLKILERRLALPVAPPIGGGNGGQGVDATEQIFMKGAELLYQVGLDGKDKARGLGILESFCDKSRRIFIRMLLLPAMMELGWPIEKCNAVCQAGLSQEEDYYRLQAARLLVGVAERFPTNHINAEEWIHDKELGVRVYAARIYWQNTRNSQAVVPILIDALDRKKYQSYYYGEILNAALEELGRIGSDARAAKSEVAKVAQDPNPQIAKLATATLSKLGE